MTDKVTCFNCNKTITEIINDIPTPSYEECCKSGCIPVPNAGWLCSQNCASEFEKKHQVRFDRNEKGLVDYYNGKLN
jgi:hypothetical protein